MNDIKQEVSKIFDKVKQHITVEHTLKYLIEGIAIAVVAYALPNKNRDWKEVAAIALIAAVSLFVLDLFVREDAGKGALFGVGFGTGLNLLNMASPVKLPFA